MASRFNATFYIKKFRDIPEDEWTTGAFHKDGMSCALGHLGAPKKNHKEVMGIIRLFEKYLGVKPAAVNDWQDLRFQEPGPKNRIMAALNQIKAIRRKGN